MQRLEKIVLVGLWIFCIGLVAPASIGRAWQSEPTGTPTPIVSTDVPQIVILSPSDGQAVIGKVQIEGSTNIVGFASAELTFAYDDNPTQTWFLIATSTEPVREGTLAEWDTSTISDGLYDLRLLVTRQDSEALVYTVEGLRVRNYTSIETNTPTPVTPTSTPLPGDTPVPTSTPTPTETPIPPTPTKLPPNPVQVTLQDFTFSLGKGIAITAGAFALLGIYISIKKLRKPS